MSISMPFAINSIVSRNMRIGVAAVLLSACLAAMVALAVDVRSRLIALERANSDNVQWVLTQAEVEILRLQLATQQALQDPQSSLHEVRLRYDLLFSRLAIFQHSPIYQPVLSGWRYDGDIKGLQAFLNQAVPLIDGPDPALRLALPGIVNELPGLHGLMRAMTVRATQDFAMLAEMQRKEMANTLIRLAAVTVLMVILLSFLVVALLRLYRQTRAQAEVNRLTAARLATVVQGSVDGIIVTEANGRIIDMNNAAEAMFGVQKMAVIGRDALKTLTPPDVSRQQQDQIDAVLPMLNQLGEAPFRMEIDGQRADGSRFPIELSLATAAALPGDYRYGREGPGLVMGFMRDISDRRRSEAALTEAAERAQAGERAKAEFLAVMSHEMRTPLNGMLGSVELLTDTALDLRQRELVTVLERSGQILLGHVNSVLDLTRAEAGQSVPRLRAVNLDMLIADCVANQTALAGAAGTQIVTTALSGPIGPVLTDQIRVGQIVLNLLGNAVKFTHNGKITVETEIVEPATDQQAANLVEIRVIDSGAGIAQDQLDRIFEDFVTLPSGQQTASGTGLGLGISRRLAQALGGEIGAESVLGEGSLFWLRLPLLPALAEDATDQPAPVLAKNTALDILMIEDNAINRFILKDFLQSAGHQVTEAVDGAEGISMAGAHCFDVILTDISMPGMNGVTVARQIRDGQQGGASQSTRIFALTAHALPEEIARFREAGMEGCLIKPINRADLLSALRKGNNAAPPALVEHDSLLDYGQIAAIATQIGPRQCAAVLRKIRAEGDALIGQILATAKTDTAEMIRICHHLGGSAGTIGACKLLTQLTEIQSQSKRGQPIAIRVAGLPKLWHRTAVLLDQSIIRYEQTL